MINKIIELDALFNTSDHQVKKVWVSGVFYEDRNRRIYLAECTESRKKYFLHYIKQNEYSHKEQNYTLVGDLLTSKYSYQYAELKDISKVVACGTFGYSNNYLLSEHEYGSISYNFFHIHKSIKEQLAHQLVESLASLHQLGFCIGRLSINDILITQDKKILLLDHSWLQTGILFGENEDQECEKTSRSKHEKLFLGPEFILGDKIDTDINLINVTRRRHRGTDVSDDPVADMWPLGILLFNLFEASPNNLHSSRGKCFPFREKASEYTRYIHEYNYCFSASDVIYTSTPANWQLVINKCLQIHKSNRWQNAVKIKEHLQSN